MENKSKKAALKNNIYAFKLLWGMAPKLVINKGIARFLGYFEWLFYSAFFMRYVVGALEAGEGFFEIIKFLIITVVIFAGISFHKAYLQGELMPEYEPIVNSKLYRLLFTKVRNVELSCFEDSEFYDKYTLAMEKADVRLVETVDVIWGILFGFVASILAFLFMFSVDPYSVLFIIFPFVGNFVFNRKLAEIEFERNKDMAPHNRRMAYVNRVMYLPEYAKELRLTDVFSLMKRQYKAAIYGVTEVTKKYTIKGMIFHWLYVNFTFSFIFEGLLIYGSYRALISKTISLAQLAVITSMMVSTTWILIGFTQSLSQSFKNGLFIDYLKSFLNHKETIPEDYKGDDPGERIESIEFRNVSFGYKEDMIITNLNLKFEGGHTYALAGHNGAGKTTIIKLLLRFYDPTEGEILLNGRNIKEYDLSKYRRLFATAFQDNNVFSMSIKDNVIMDEAIDDNDKDKVATWALKEVGIFDKVSSLKHGINTTLTREFDEEGAELSGGEIQKIVVARAFVRNSPIKIFDEPSSALDPIAEYELFEHIYNDCKENTLIFISHRLSSVKDADRIYLLENGRVLEEGTHGELIKLHGRYAEMYTKQAENYLSEVKV